MKVVQGITETELKVIVKKAWEEKDAAFYVDYYDNTIGVFSGSNAGVYQFEEKQIMSMAVVLLDGVQKYASEFKFVQVNIAVQLLGKRRGVDKVLKAFGCEDKLKPIMNTPYTVFLQ